MAGPRGGEQLPAAPGELARARGRDPRHHEQAHEAAAHGREVRRQEGEWNLNLLRWCYRHMHIGKMFREKAQWKVQEEHIRVSVNVIVKYGTQ